MNMAKNTDSTSIKVRVDIQSRPVSESQRRDWRCFWTRLVSHARNENENGPSCSQGYISKVLKDNWAETGRRDL